MKILTEILSTLDYAAAVRNICQGVLQTAVLTRHCGLASTPHDAGSHGDKAPVKEAGALLDRSPEMLAQLALSSSELEAAIGMATINSLIDVDEARCRELNAGDLLFEKGKDKKVAVIGHFPFTPSLRTVAGELWVIEKNPQAGDHAADEAERLVPQADIVAITGTAFTNHTIDDLLNLCNKDAYVVVLGGTVPLSPVLFDYGIDAISGTVVTDPDTVLLCVSQGATFRQIKGIRRLTMTGGRA